MSDTPNTPNADGALPKGASIPPIAPPDARLTLLAEWTEPSASELSRLLASRVTRADADRVDNVTTDAIAQATEPSWAEEVRVWKRQSELAGQDPRVGFWARATEPTEAEVGRVGSHAPPLVVGLWTQPTDAEVTRLCARRAELIRDGRTSSLWSGSAWPLRGLGIGVAAAAAAALVVVATVSWPSSYGTPDLVQGETTTLAAADIIDLGPSIDLMPHAVPGYDSPRVHVAAASALGTIVDVLEGGTRFEVDPKGHHRELTVRAGDVEVHVRGTIFSVDRLDDGVEVFVERGKVQVDSPEGTLYLTAGQRWHSGDGLVSLGQSDQPASLGVLEPIEEPAAPEEVEEPPPETVAEPVQEVAAAPVKPPIQAAPVPGTSEPQGIPESAAGPWVTDETIPAAKIVREQRATPTDQAGTSVDTTVGTATTTQSQVALPELLKLRKRFSAGESSRTLLQDVESFLEQSGQADLLPMAMELRVDVSRRDGTRMQFERAVLGLLQHDPAHPDRGRLLVETGRRWMQANDIQRALAAFKLAAAIPNNDGIHGLIGIADCEGTLGRPKEARAALSEALRIVADPDLEEELRARLQRLDRR